MKHKLAAKLRGKSGASLVFVLGIMLMLLIIGTSALVAASAVAGGNVSQQNYVQLEQFSSSVQKNFMYSLQKGEMGTRLLWALYDAVGTAAPLKETAKMNLDPWPETLPASLKDTELKLELHPDIRCVEQKRWQPSNDGDGNQIYDEDGEPIYEEVVVSRTYYIGAMLSVRNTVLLGERKLLSVAEYEFTGGIIEVTGATESLVELGTWRLLSNENLNDNLNV